MDALAYRAAEASEAASDAVRSASPVRVVDELGTLTRAEHLKALASRQTLVMVLPPALRSQSMLVDALDEGFRLLRGRNAGRDNTEVRLSHHMARGLYAGVENVVVRDAHHGTPSVWQGLISLANSWSARLWLVTDENPLPRKLAVLSEDHAITATSWRTFTDGLQLPDEPIGTDEVEPADREADLPELPTSDWWDFRARCAETLTDTQRARVFCAVRDWHRRALEVPDDADLIAGFLRGIVEEQLTEEQRLVAVRAAQLAFFGRDTLVTVDVAQLERAARSYEAEALTAEQAHLIDRLPNITQASIVMVNQLGMSLQEMLALRMGDIPQAHPWTIERGGGTALHVPPFARHALLLGRLLRVLEGAKPDDPFFPAPHWRSATPHATNRMSLGGVRHRLRINQRDLSLPITTKRRPEHSKSDRSWCQRNHIRIHRFGVA